MRTMFGLVLVLSACTKAEVDGDGDGSPADVDCDDTNSDIFPGAPEVCNGLDDDCDVSVDDDASDALTFYVDVDGDGTGVDAGSVVACDAPDGMVSVRGDCDDADAAYYPGATEDNCTDPNDYDCDGVTLFADADADGFPACEDCDDADRDVNDAAAEVCNDRDDDCDGTIDGPTSADAATFYRDGDGDGFGDAGITELACSPGAGFVANGDDCNDLDARLHDTCFPRFTGTFGTSWETLAAPTTDLYSLITYKSARIPYIYNMYSSPGWAYDTTANRWTQLGSEVPYVQAWTTMAPVGDELWMLRNDTVYRYDPADDLWDAPATTVGGDDLNMTESDEFGVVYGHTQSGALIVYDTVAESVEYLSTGLGSQYETRLAYDPSPRGILFGAYDQPALYRIDLETGMVTTLATHPENQLNDIFCGDRSGHVYAAGDRGGTTIFQYDVASDRWLSIPDLPGDHGNNGSCTVSDDGWLYVGTGSNRSFYRLKLDLE